LTFRDLGEPRVLPAGEIVADSGDPVLLGANAAPGMTETSLLPQAVAAAGLELDVVYRALVEAAR